MAFRGAPMRVQLRNEAERFSIAMMSSQEAQRYLCVVLLPGRGRRSRQGRCIAQEDTPSPATSLHKQNQGELHRRACASVCRSVLSALVRANFLTVQTLRTRKRSTPNGTMRMRPGAKAVGAVPRAKIRKPRNFQFLCWSLYRMTGAGYPQCAQL